MRRHASAWAVFGNSHEMQTIPVAEGVGMPEGHGDGPENGQGFGTAGGVVEHGTREEDGPGTWETRVSLRADTGAMETR